MSALELQGRDIHAAGQAVAVLREAPGSQFSLKTETIFADSRVSLNKWLVAIWMIANSTNGISSYEIHQALGVPQKTARFIGHGVRLMLHEGSFKQWWTVRSRSASRSSAETPGAEGCCIPCG